MTKKSINSQVRDYLLGRLSEAEQLELEQQLSQHPEWIQEMRQMEDADFTQLYETYEKFGSDEVLQQLKLKVLENKQSQETDHPTVHRHMFQWWRYAAAVLLLAVAGAGYWWYSDYTKVTPPVISQEVKLAMEQSKQSGHDAAVIDNVNVNDNGGKSVKELVEEMQLPEDVVEKLEEAKRITTYHNKEYWVTLPDGSLVHLNNNSRLIYPEKFGDRRDMILDGEAYFMVAKDKSRQFVVHTPQGEIRVYGTEFWVKTDYKATAPRATEDAAAGEATGQAGETVVALVRGTIGFTPADGREQMLKPGQELTAVNSQLTVTDVDTTPYTAWNTGLFVFENSTLEHLMDVLAQWYDIKKVNYTDDKLRKIHFTGNLKRYGSAERIMKAIMMACDVNIVLQNDTLSVSN